MSKIPCDDCLRGLTGIRPYMAHHECFEAYKDCVIGDKNDDIPIPPTKKEDLLLSIADLIARIDVELKTLEETKRIIQERMK